MTKTALIIGGGPAGLMAAEQLAAAGLDVTITEAKPSLGRKFLMAGKSGLNLTKVEDTTAFLTAYTEAQKRLGPILDHVPPQAVIAWANDLGADVFTGSTGRVFPKVMKASPLLRAWLRRLAEANVTLLTRWRWLGFMDGAHQFDTPDGPRQITPDITIYAMGGASWRKLGSDGTWAADFAKRGIALAPFAPANSALGVSWSHHMLPFFGTPLKAISLRCQGHITRGEAILSQKGLEGGGIYSISKWARTGADVFVDLAPDRSHEDLETVLTKAQGKKTLSNILRTAARLDPIKIALLQECARPLPSHPKELAQRIKSLKLPIHGPAPMDEAISTAGGVAWSELDANLMLIKQPGHFCVGEMIDWEAPTGGYLLTACFATGAWAGQQAARFADQT